MQAERSVYEAASRAVLHQREPDGTRKAPTPTPPPEGGPSPPAGTAPPSLVISRPFPLGLLFARHSQSHAPHVIGSVATHGVLCWDGQ